MDPSPTSSETYEETHVHSVYEAIAPHFSSTRYKVIPPSPLVPFLSALTNLLASSLALAPRCHFSHLPSPLLSRRRSRLRQRQESPPWPVTLLHRLRPLCGTGLYSCGSVPRRWSRSHRCLSSRRRRRRSRRCARAAASMWEVRLCYQHRGDTSL